MSQLPPALRDRVLATRATLPSAPSGAWERRQVLALALVLLWTASGVVFLEMRDNWGQLPLWYRLSSLLLTLGIGAGLLFLGFWRGRYMVGPPAWVARLGSVGGPLLALFWVVLVAFPTAPPGDWLSEARGAIHCHVIATVGALPMLGALLWLRRGLTLPAPGLLGACLGASAAAWSHAMMFSVCPTGGAVHASLGHVMPSLPVMLLGALVGLRVFR
jgi:hypothetical protein